MFGPLQVMTALTLFTQDYRPTVVGETLEPVDTESPARLLPDKIFVQVSHPFGLIIPEGRRRR